MSNTPKISRVSAEAFKATVDPAPVEKQLRLDNAALRRRIEELKTSIGENENFFFELTQSVKDMKLEPVKILYTPPKSSKVVRPVSEVWHFTDWHIGEVVSPDEVEGFNAFDYAIACDRVQHYTKTCLNMTELYRTNYTINELVIICTADFISGDIHDELRVTNEWPVPVQCAKAGRLLGEAIRAAAPYFASVRVEFIVPDNHSRLTKKVQFKESGLNSYNYVVGYIAQMMVADVKNVTFNMYPQIQQVIEVQRMRYLCRHGNGIKGTWGIPYYGVDRVASQAAKARINRARKHHFHKLLIGHFHAPLRFGPWQIGGSLNGTTEFDHGSNRYAGPAQTMWLVHPEHGEFNYNEIWLSDGSPLGIPGATDFLDAGIDED